MTEIFFVLTIIYAAYVIFVSMTDKEKPHVIDDSAPAMLSVKDSGVKPLIPDNIKTKPLEKPIAMTKSLKDAVKDAPKKAGLKNPQTGEIATSYANYRFMKRWIKEALVAEGLLEKVYKNNELDVEVEVKIKEAIAQLEAIDSYQV
jgi:hypothetical protein